MPSQAQQHSVFGLRCEIEGQYLEWVLHPGVTTVGSQSDNDVVIPAPQVSRRHAKLMRQDDAFWLEDLGSTNGTYVNGLKVNKAKVRLGDSICFGSIATFIDHLDANDTRPALLPEAKLDERASIEPTGDDAMTANEQAVIPASWLSVLRQIAEAAASRSETRLAAALESVRSAVGAQTVLTFRLGIEEGPSLETIAGDWPAGKNLEDFARRIESQLANTSSDNLSDELLLEGDPQAAVVTNNQRADSFLALTAIGDLPQPESSLRLLAECLQLLTPAPDETFQPMETSPPKRTNLVFPSWYVQGSSPTMMRVYQQLGQLVAGNLPILITGETGVGKEAIAHSIHLSSKRSAGPFVAVNCAAIPSGLLEAELFGIEKGVATGVAAREGKMSLARGGILFLDEISEMSPALQAKLLRALQENKVHSVGARRPVPLDVRVVSATNADLPTRIKQGLFRRDVYYRLAGCTVEVPPLRERSGDIPALVQHFLRRAAAELGKRIRGISVSALGTFMDADWPGNIRELEHEVRRLVALCPPDQLITSRLLQRASQSLQISHPGVPLESAASLKLGPRIIALERDTIVKALEKAGGNRSEAARLLGISRYGLYLKLKRLGLLPDETTPNGGARNGQPG